jgi:hypothetical protein
MSGARRRLSGDRELRIMSLKKIISPVLMAAIAAGSLVPMSTAANAGDWRHRSYGNSVHVRQYSGAPHSNRWAHRDNRGDYSGHRNHHGRNLAIGAFAAILGLAIAAQASQAQDYDYDDEDDYRN